MYWTAMSGGGVPRRNWNPGGSSRDTAERHAETAAADWQIILHLRTLILRNPAIITDLLADARNRPISYLTTLYAATREAVSDQADNADLHYFAAAAAIHLGRLREAEHALDEAIRLAPHFGAAHLLAARLALESREPVRAHERLTAAERSGAPREEIAALRARLGGPDTPGEEREATRG